MSLVGGAGEGGGEEKLRGQFKSWEGGGTKLLRLRTDFFLSKNLFEFQIFPLILE